MSGAETARRPVVQRRIAGAKSAVPKWPSPWNASCFHSGLPVEVGGKYVSAVTGDRRQTSWLLFQSISVAVTRDNAASVFRHRMFYHVIFEFNIVTIIIFFIKINFITIFACISILFKVVVCFRWTWGLDEQWSTLQSSLSLQFLLNSSSPLTFVLEPAF